MLRLASNPRWSSPLSTLVSSLTAMLNRPGRLELFAEPRCHTFESILAVAAEYFDGRTDVQCLHRWQKVLNPEVVKGPWTPEVCD